MKKQLFAAFLAFVMVITLLPSSAFAAAALILAPESISAELKTGAEIAVKISGSNNPGFAAGTVRASWDASALTLKSVKYSDLAPENIPAAIASDASSCVLSFGDYMAHENFKENGTFFTLIFSVSMTAKAGDYPILLSDADIVSTDLKAVPTQLQAGCVSLTGKETDKNTLRLKVGTASAAITSTEQIKVPVSADISPGFSAGRVNVIWDYAAQKLTGIEFSEAAPDNGTPAIINDGSQPVAIGDYLAKENITGTDTLFILVFEKNEQAAAGTYPVMIASEDMIDCTMKKIPAVFASGAVILEYETTAATNTTTTTKDTSTTTSTAKDTITSTSKSTTTSSTAAETTTKKSTTTTAASTTAATTTKKSTTTTAASTTTPTTTTKKVTTTTAASTTTPTTTTKKVTATTAASTTTPTKTTKKSTTTTATPTTTTKKSTTMTAASTTTPKTTTKKLLPRPQHLPPHRQPRQRNLLLLPHQPPSQQHSQPHLQRSQRQQLHLQRRQRQPSYPQQVRHQLPHLQQMRRLLQLRQHPRQPLPAQQHRQLKPL